VMRDAAAQGPQVAWITEERRREVAEEWHLLYVAMTRAKQYLLVSGHERRGADQEDPPSWYEAISRAVVASDLRPTGWQMAEADVAVQPSPTRLRTKVKRYSIGSERLAETAEQAFGTAFHLALETLAGLPEDEWRKGLAGIEPPVAEAVARVLGNPACQAFFHGTAILESFDEREMLGDDGAVLRPDRIVKRADGWWIIDYKSSPNIQHPHPAIAQQLAAYRRALQRAMGGKMTIRSVVIDPSGNIIEYAG
jgi:ATP-dependent helicase/nuclease subunit A